MDIEEFIPTTLTQIIDGVKKAQDATLMVLKKHKTQGTGGTWRRRRHG